MPSKATHAGTALPSPRFISPSARSAARRARGGAFWGSTETDRLNVAARGMDLSVIGRCSAPMRA